MISTTPGALRWRFAKYSANPPANLTTSQPSQPQNAAACRLAALIDWGRIDEGYGTRLPAPVRLSVIAAATFATAGAVYLKNFYLLAPTLLLWVTALMFCFLPSAKLIINSVPPDNKGEVSGIAIAVRLSEGTLGMMSGTLTHGTTDHIWPIFAVTGPGMIVVLAVSFPILNGKSRLTTPKTG